ncbi:hypothetical protein ACFPYI_20975 [Halomarina salina]|uniref:DUF8136 domain-containing protein n=1 Tax=Halomarina salina TaxID=1872699 RepID=A0ABD5RTD1_9EURY|nr:hypothetical protein [Halomarina salina]
MTDDDPPGDPPPDIDDILSLLEAGIREAHRKVENGRVRDAENEKVRIKWIRALAYSAGQYRQLLRDKELEELNDRIEELEEQQQRP